MKVFSAKSAFDIFELIQKNPKRYLINSDIYALQNFINGYLLGNPYPDDEPPFWDFENYLLFKTNYKFVGKTNLISQILLDECSNDEKKAYNCFFEYLELYKNSKK